MTTYLQYKPSAIPISFSCTLCLVLVSKHAKTGKHQHISMQCRSTASKNYNSSVSVLQMYLTSALLKI